MKPIATIRTGDYYYAPTLTQVDGAKTITTPELRNMMMSSHPSILIGVLDGTQWASLPGAVWLPGAGLGRNLHDDVQARLAAKLADLTNGDKSKTLAFFC